MTRVHFPTENFTNANVTKLNVANVEHPEFFSVFPFPRTPVTVADCLLDDPVKWIGLKVGSSPRLSLNSLMSFSYS